MFVRETNEPTEEIETVTPPKPQSQVPHIDPTEKKPKAAVVKKFEEKNKAVEMDDLLPPQKD